MFRWKSADPREARLRRRPDRFSENWSALGWPGIPSRALLRCGSADARMSARQCQIARASSVNAAATCSTGATTKSPTPADPPPAHPPPRRPAPAGAPAPPRPDQPPSARTPPPPMPPRPRPPSNHACRPPAVPTPPPRQPSPAQPATTRTDAPAQVGQGRLAPCSRVALRRRTCGSHPGGDLWIYEQCLRRAGPPALRPGSSGAPPRTPALWEVPALRRAPEASRPGGRRQTVRRVCLWPAAPLGRSPRYGKPSNLRSC
jgi:hypothetical protein